MKTNLSPLSKQQKTIMGKAVALLQRNGSITTIECNKLGTVDARKMFTVMRKLGLLYKPTNKKGYKWELNKNGGQHKRHFWTGKKVIG